MEKSTHVPTPDEIWKILKETANSLKKEQAERKKEQAEREHERKQAEAERKKEQAERKKEQEKMAQERAIEWRKVEKSIKRLSDLFSNQWGDLLEALVEKSLVRIFKNWDMKVSRTIHHLPGSYKGKEREFDFVVINGNELVVIEVKSTLNQKKTDYFAKTMADFTNYCHEYKGFKVYAGVAYLKADENTVKYAIKKGLFVIRIGSDTAHLINKEGFKPKVF